MQDPAPIDSDEPAETDPLTSDPEAAADDARALSGMEADLDSVDAVLEAIDRDDLDTAEAIVSGLEASAATDAADQMTPRPESA
jgi:hypothetical protein